MNIVLTGSNGFIGSNIKDTIFSDSKYSDTISSVISIEQPYMDYTGWESTLSKAVGDSDYIIHIGAISDTMLQDNNKMMKYNYEFSKVLFDLAKIWDKPVIYASSAANDGDNGLPSNFYGWSKYVTEQYGLNVVDKFYALRYFNVYGPGEEHKGNMSSVAYQSWNKGWFTLFPGEPRRDFIHIDDVVKATLLPILKPNCSGGIYHVGTGESKRFEDVLDSLGLKYDYHEESKVPKGYQYHTQAEPKMMLPAWIPMKFEEGMKKYKQYLEGR
tara:strand:+ start:1368 stop:2180 length:813 start_codon:yes stop_codon:yes gene_type:complete